jgi:uncharacterized protein YndB with AHSA1/START domain
VPEQQGETSVVDREIRIEAEAETVFPFLTHPDRMVRWMGLRATLDPRPGGVFSVDMVGDFGIEGEYLEVVPPSRVVFTWGYRDFPEEHNPLPVGSSTVEVDLVPDGAATIVRLRHHVTPQLADFHALGWDNYLGRLADVAAGRDPGPDPFMGAVESMTAGDA